MRYGCIPIASAVGGLKDTIQDVMNMKTEQVSLLPIECCNLASRLDDTIKLFQDKERWFDTEKCDEAKFRVEVSAKAYVKLYTMLKLKNQNPVNNHCAMKYAYKKSI
jgi:glycogen synthase